MDINLNVSNEKSSSSPIHEKQICRLPLPKDKEKCKSCPYPRVGFICWNQDGSCMRTDEQEISRKGMEL